ncbi:hypothetical protein C8R31_10527 [Nitrosospira sp. Nsp2]|nr:hypothetical protein C8R31_10527 [Nitrosospira sp. Nsp2]
MQRAYMFTRTPSRGSRKPVRWKTEGETLESHAVNEDFAWRVRL